MKRLILRWAKNFGATQQQNNATGEEGDVANQDEIALTEIY